MLLGVAALELLALGLARRGKARYVHLASGVLGLGALFSLYEAAEHGGELVYAYAGGVGLQRKDPADVGRLLLARPLPPGPGRPFVFRQDVTLLREGGETM